MKSDARAIMCVPVNYKDRNLGTLYLDNRAGAAGFSEGLIRLALSFAGAAAGAIENARLYENIEEETQKRSNLSRYLSPAVVDDILSQGEEISLGGSTVECSVLFDADRALKRLAQSHGLLPRPVVFDANEPVLSHLLDGLSLPAGQIRADRAHGPTQRKSRLHIKVVRQVPVIPDEAAAAQTSPSAFRYPGVDHVGFS